MHQNTLHYYILHHYILPTCSTWVGEPDTSTTPASSYKGVIGTFICCTPISDTMISIGKLIQATQCLRLCSDFFLTNTRKRINFTTAKRGYQVSTEKNEDIVALEHLGWSRCLQAIIQGTKYSRSTLQHQRHHRLISVKTLHPQNKSRTVI